VPHTQLPSGGAYSFEETYNTHSAKLFTSLFTVLDAYPGRTFTLTPSALIHFQKWFASQTFGMRQKVRNSFNLGYVEVVGGSLGDIEGTCTNYQEVIRNIIMGT
jgi:hypothetical protein